MNIDLHARLTSTMASTSSPASPSSQSTDASSSRSSSGKVSPGAGSDAPNEPITLAPKSSLELCEPWAPAGCEMFRLDSSGSARHWKTSCRLSMKRDTSTAVILRNAQRGKKGCYYSSAWVFTGGDGAEPASSRSFVKHVRFGKHCKVADGLDGVGADLGGWLGTNQ